jgi:hypothetical protein
MIPVTLHIILVGLSLVSGIVATVGIIKTLDSGSGTGGSRGVTETHTAKNSVTDSTSERPTADA